MTFARPDLLWLLLLGVPVILFHLVRRRRRRLRIPSLLLWERALAAEPRRFGAGVLSGLLSLLLMLLAVGAATLAAADPGTGAPAPGPKPLLLLVSSSARMEGERWARALRIAGEELARKAPFDPVTVLLVSDRPGILAVADTDGGSVLEKLRGAKPSLVFSGWDLAGPAALDAARAGARVVAIGVRPALPAGDGIAVHAVGGGNSGISGFGVEVGEEVVRVYLRAAEGAGEFVFLLGDREVARLPVSPEVVHEFLRGDDGGWLTVAVEPPSGPAFDDRVRAWVPPRGALRVGVVADAERGIDPFLRAALSVAGPLIDEAGSGVVPVDRVREVAGRFDVLVLLGTPPSGRLPQGNWILLTPPPEALGFDPLPIAESAPIWRLAADHPVTRGVDAAEVQVAGAVPAGLPEGAEALLSVPGGAVAAAGERAGVRYVWIGLDTENSTLPVSGAYPLMIRNALRWFARLRVSPLPPSVRMGEAVAPVIRLPSGINAVSLSGPERTDRAVLEVVDGAFAFRPASRTEGEVVLRVGKEEHRTWVNALLPGETEVDPAGGEPVYGPDRSGLADTEERLWSWFVGAAALFLLLEWFLPGR